MMSRRQHAAADQEEREEKLEGGHNAAAAQGEESRSHQGRTHEWRKHAAGDMRGEGRKGNSLFMLAAIQRGFLATHLCAIPVFRL